jgi:hypothetical protein
MEDVHYLRFFHSEPKSSCTMILCRSPNREGMLLVLLLYVYVTTCRAKLRYGHVRQSRHRLNTIPECQ